MASAFNNSVRVCAVAAGALSSACALAQPGIDGWSHLGGSSTHAATVAAPAPELTTRWVCGLDASGNAITFVPSGGIGVGRGYVFAAGKVRPAGSAGDLWRLYAVDRDSGVVAWAAPIAAPVLDSASMPVVDKARGVVIHASARVVGAYAIVGGAPVWQTTLQRSVVNASVVIADDLPFARAFVTDYDGFGTQGRLYCINLAPLSAANPFAPGAIVWSVGIGGSSGNTPAYLPRALGGRGLVYVASVGEYGFTGGAIAAYPADAADAPAPAWVYTVDDAEQGFFGAVSVAPAEAPGAVGVQGRPHVFAATYAFSGGLEAARLVKVGAVDGALVWSIACNRTQAAPAFAPGGRVVLAGGIGGFGTVPGVELIQDAGESAARVWQTATATWNDLDGDLLIDAGEYLRIGGWTQQAIVTRFAGRSSVLVGAAGAGSGSVAGPLYVVDLDQGPAGSGPSGSGFVLGVNGQAGGPPSVAGGSAYSIGGAGLVAMGLTPGGTDVNDDARVNIDDLYAWEAVAGTRDVNGDGVVNAVDRGAITARLRSAEPVSMMGGLR